MSRYPIRSAKGVVPAGMIRRGMIDRSGIGLMEGPGRPDFGEQGRGMKIGSDMTPSPLIPLCTQRVPAILSLTQVKEGERKMEVKERISPTRGEESRDYC